MHEALADMDVGRCMDLWRAAFPNMPCPETIAEAEIAMHMARTATESLPKRARVWSFQWLEERGLPSHLPDEMKPDRPEIATGVGIAVRSLSHDPDRVARASALQEKLAGAVEDAFLSGVRDAPRLKSMMNKIRSEF